MPANGLATVRGLVPLDIAQTDLAEGFDHEVDHPVLEGNQGHQHAEVEQRHHTGEHPRQDAGDLDRDRHGVPTRHLGVIGE